MTEFNQGDIIKISGFKKQLFVIVSKKRIYKSNGYISCMSIDFRDSSRTNTSGSER